MHQFQVGSTYKIIIEQFNGSFKTVGHATVESRTEKTVKFAGQRSQKIYHSISQVSGRIELAYPVLTGMGDTRKIYATELK
ncbi:hypothetical protein EVB91_172 [Rhizobium phage RHph_I1_18]|nr:hypothetical protein EVB91_172 [Rhizobium phage RHph_I1_18]